MKKKRTVLTGTAVILFVMLAFYAVGKSNVTAVNTAEVQKKNIYYSILADGEITLQNASLLYTKQAGTINYLFVKTGDKVRKGDPILTFMASNVPTVDLQEQTVATLLEALEEGKISGQEDLQSAVETLAPQQEPEDGDKGKKILITAPADGTVISLPSLNSQVFPGIAMGKVGDLNHLSVEAKVPEEYIKSVKVGQKAKISGMAFGDTVYQGKVTSLQPYASKSVSFTGDDTKTYVKVMIALNGSASALRPGYSADVKIFTDKVKNAIVLPYGAVFQDKTTEYVYKWEDGKAVRQKIQTGYELSSKIQVTEGLNVGDKVILNPQDVTDGEQVRIKNG